MILQSNRLDLSIREVGLSTDITRFKKSKHSYKATLCIVGLFRALSWSICPGLVQSRSGAASQGQEEPRNAAQMEVNWSIISRFLLPLASSSRSALHKSRADGPRKSAEQANDAQRGLITVFWFFLILSYLWKARVLWLRDPAYCSAESFLTNAEGWHGTRSIWQKSCW